MPSENRSNHKKIQVWIPLPLWNELVSMGYSSPTNAVITALQLLTTKSQDTPIDSQETPMSNELGELKMRLEEKDARIGDIKIQVELLTEQLRKQNASDELKITELKENYHNRIEDFKTQMYSLDNQLRTKDDQIEKLNENMHKQAVHIQTLIQEISQLNVKLLPESTKKPWYRFW